MHYYKNHFHKIDISGEVKNLFTLKSQQNRRQQLWKPLNSAYGLFHKVKTCSCLEKM